MSRLKIANRELTQVDDTPMPVISPRGSSLLFYITQNAGFHHIHRPTMAVRPHCVFDVLVPFFNSSHFAQIPGEFCIPEHLTGGAAVGDYDEDGLEDIYFTVFHGNSVLYRNNGEHLRQYLSTNSGKKLSKNGVQLWEVRFGPVNTGHCMYKMNVYLKCGS